MRLMSIPAGQPRRHEDGQEMATRSQGCQARIHFTVSISSPFRDNGRPDAMPAAALIVLRPLMSTCQIDKDTNVFPTREMAAVQRDAAAGPAADRPGMRSCPRSASPCRRGIWATWPIPRTWWPA